MAQPAFLTTRTPSRRKYYILLSTPLSTSLAVPIAPLTKPEGLKVIALVFFGRVDRISILDCYLRQNLVLNGGWLDEVIFVVNAHIVIGWSGWIELLRRRRDIAGGAGVKIVGGRGRGG
jgi:hypothetical protein